MMKKVFCIAFFAVALALAASAGQWVRVNQLGYLPQATKVAVFMSNEDCQGSDFDLVDAFTVQREGGEYVVAGLPGQRHGL